MIIFDLKHLQDLSKPTFFEKCSTSAHQVGAQTGLGEAPQMCQIARIIAFETVLDASREATNHAPGREKVASRERTKIIFWTPPRGF